MAGTSMKELHFDRVVPAAPKQVYRAFTHSTALREWLCDYATAVPRVGGRFYVAWNEGYFAAGAFTLVKEETQLAFSWMGRDDPGQTQVQIVLEPQADNTHVYLVHSGFGEGKQWSQVYEQIEHGWRRALENLVSVIGFGPDLRITTRPMMGVLFSDFNGDIARSLGVPVAEGARLENTVENLGAWAAGLTRNDIIVELGGQPVRSFNDFEPILSHHRAGETVKVGFYRGMERKELPMLLSARPLPEIPATPEELASAVQQIYDEQMDALEAVLSNATEYDADFRPSEREWSMKEVMTHLILTERSTSTFIAELASGFERVTDDFGENLPERVPELAKSYPKLTDALAAFKLACRETICMLAILPENFVARKGSYWRLAYGMLTSFYHMSDHREQIAAALRSSKGK